MKHFLAVVCLFVATTAFAGDHIVRFAGKVPDSFDAAVMAAGGTLRSAHRDAGFAFVSGISSEAAAALAANAGAVESLPDATFKLQTVADPTTAPYYPIQWNLRAIGADVAWAAGRLGSSDVTVAVIDTGIGYTHPDLNGRVDLSRSVSFVPGDDAVVASMFPGLHPVTDLHYHGTHVASTIASNAVIAAGVTSKVTLIGVKVISRNGEGSVGDVLNGVLWAADHGADVANMSIAGWLPKQGDGREIGSIQQAMNYAHRKGTLIVAAAGNEAADLDHNTGYYTLFCESPNVVCVSATGPTSGGINGPWANVDRPAYYTNYGRSAISVAAPGGSRAGYIWGACSKTALAFTWCHGPGNDFLLLSTGTSMAAPHVSGLAALIVEDVGHGKPSQVRARLLQTADDLGQKGTDPYYGKGRINVPRALGLQ